MRRLVYVFAALAVLIACGKQPEEVEDECDEPTQWEVIYLNKHYDEKSN